MFNCMCSFWVAFFVTNYTNLIASIGVGVSCWYNNALLVSYLCASFIKPCVATIGAVPVFNITVSCACCCYCINMYECMCSIRVAFFVTNYTNLIASISVGVSSWYNNAHLVSYLCASLIKPCVTTNFAVPIFNITVGCACCCYCINMCECMCSIRVAFFVTNLTNLVAFIEVAVAKSIAVSQSTNCTCLWSSTSSVSPLVTDSLCISICLCFATYCTCGQCVTWVASCLDYFSYFPSMAKRSCFWEECTCNLSLKRLTLEGSKSVNLNLDSICIYRCGEL